MSEGDWSSDGCSSDLEEVVAGTKVEYAALPEAERSEAKKLSIVRSRMDLLGQMERTCDSEVKKVVAELERLLTLNGQDTALAKKVWEAYEKEKSLKKAYYINELSWAFFNCL